jgi:hypothetical protein
VIAAFAAGAIWVTCASGAESPLVLEAKVPLGQVRGRIDHLAVDVARQRLFVAELGNDTVGVVDLERHTVLRTLTGLREPQGWVTIRLLTPCMSPMPAMGRCSFSIESPNPISMVTGILAPLERRTSLFAEHGNACTFR